MPPAKKTLTPDHLHQKAFDNSLLPNMISIVSSGKIIAANSAAEKLFGYSGKELLKKKFDEIFSSAGDQYKKMGKQRKKTGHFIGDLDVIRKNGKGLPCQVTSVIFLGDNKIKKAITTFVDRSQSIKKQTEIDRQNEKLAAAGLLLALSEAGAVLDRMHDLEQQLDEEVTAKELSIKLNAMQMANAVLEAKETERSDLGKELHDNVNQLLAASRIFLDLALRNPMNRKDHINKSSEYTLTAIEEIRKLAKGLVHDAIKNVGLCTAIGKMTHDLMAVYPLEIICKMDDALNEQMNAKFKLDVFRIVQEQLNNIIKHAQAAHVQISLLRKKGGIVLSVQDDGVGFDIHQASDGIGIINIKSRAAHYRGDADFVASPGKGCVLTVSFPKQIPLE